MIYLDYAATSLKRPETVKKAVYEAMDSVGNASRGVHDISMKSSRIVYDCRRKLADFFGCKRADHVIFTSNATEALNIAIMGTIEKGDHVISTELEHNSVLRPLYALERERQVTLSFVSADKRGCINYDDFEALLNEKTKAVVCTHASNLTGNVLDLERIGKFAKEHNLLFIVDASQTAGTIPIDMEKMNIDILCFTGHKGLMGPQGTGGLCIREGIEIRPWKCGGSGVHSYDKEQPMEYPTRLEAGTLNTHGIAGLSAAVDFINETGLKAIEKKKHKLTRMFYEGVKDIEGVTVYGDFETEAHSAVVTLNIWDYDSSEVADELAVQYDIATRAGAHCAPKMHEALGTKETGAVRFSFGWFNTEEEIKAAIEAVKKIAE